MHHHSSNPHHSPFQSLARQTTRSTRTTNQTGATTISSRLSYPRASLTSLLEQIARAEPQHLARATSASASSAKKRTFGDFALGEKVEVAREDVEMVDAPPIEQIHTEQPITLSVGFDPC